MQPSWMDTRKCNGSAADSSPSELVRKLATWFPDLAAQMPDPLRLPLYPMANRAAVQLFREKHTPRVRCGGRAHAR